MKPLVFLLTLATFLLGVLLIGLLLLPLSCKESYTPKPMGYVRIDYPEKSYRLYDEQAQYSFEIPEYAQVVPDQMPSSSSPVPATSSASGRSANTPEICSLNLSWR